MWFLSISNNIKLKSSVSDSVISSFLFFSCSVDFIAVCKSQQSENSVNPYITVECAAASNLFFLPIVYNS